MIPEPPTAVLDTECYRNFWLAKMKDVATGEVLTFRHPFEPATFAAALRRYRLVTFNGAKYDMPMIALALTGATCSALKDASDAIIQRNSQPWQFEDLTGCRIPNFDHVDLFEVCPAPKASLKIYGGRLHCHKMQDLPYPPDAILTPEQMDEVATYCENDLDTTIGLWRELRPQVRLRETLGRDHGVDLRSKSDAQIAEAVIKSKLGYKPARPDVMPGSVFHYDPPTFIRFASEPMREAFARVCESPFTIADSGAVTMTEQLEKTRIALGGSIYRMGIGGLHSSESGVRHVTDETHVLSDHDVASYYPSIILRLGMSPPQIGDAFQSIYRGVVDQRLAAKRAGDKVTADALKITVNGTFGKLGSKWSFLYAPRLLIQTTITGQLSLLMLIERLEQAGVAVVSANTDGVVVKCPRGMEAVRDAVIAEWERDTGFETEAAFYRALYSRDVNNYIAIKMDGSVKTKGAYADESLQKNPAARVAVDAVIAWLRDGVPLEATIYGCDDVRKFVTVRAVKGGGEWCGQHLGKAVRWYYAREGGEPIRYISNGNKVARSDGCKPLMELPQGVPADLDYAWYVTEAKSILADLSY